MPNYSILIPSHLLETLREKAKKLKKSSGISHHEALDTVARDFRFANWPHLAEAAKLTALSENAYKRGLVLGMDIKDATPNKTKGLVEDNFVLAFIETGFKKSRGELTEDDSDFIEKLRDEIIYFRYTGETPNSLEEALEIAGRYFFFEPQFLWIKGKWFTPFGKFDYEEEGVDDGF